MGILFNNEQHSYQITRDDLGLINLFSEKRSNVYGDIKIPSDLEEYKKLSRSPDVIESTLFHTYFTITSDDHIIKFKRFYYSIHEELKEIVLKEGKSVHKWVRTFHKVYETISFNFRTGNFYCSVLKYRGKTLIQRMVRCNRFILSAYSVEMINFVLGKWPDYMAWPSEDGILQIAELEFRTNRKLLLLVLGWLIEINDIILPNMEWNPHYLSTALYKAKRCMKKCGPKMTDWFAYMYDLSPQLVEDLFCKYPEKEPHTVLFMYKVGWEKYIQGKMPPNFTVLRRIDIDFIWPRCFTVGLGDEAARATDIIRSLNLLFDFSKKSNINLNGNLNLCYSDQTLSLLRELDGAYKLLNKSTFQIFKRNKPIEEKLSDGTRLLVRPILSISETENTLSKINDSFMIGPFGCYLNGKLTYLAGLGKKNELGLYSVKERDKGYGAQKSLGIKRRIGRIIKTTNWGTGTFRVVLNKEEIEEKFPILSTII